MYGYEIRTCCMDVTALCSVSARFGLRAYQPVLQTTRTY